MPIIEMSEKQMNMMREALEFYSRFMSGQIDALPDELRFPVNRNGKADELRDALTVLKSILFPELRFNESYSVSAPREDNLQYLRQVSYEMYRQIYVFQTEQRRLEGADVSFSVYDSPTMKYSDEKLIQIKPIESET